jgi:hypothetical protein
LSPGTLTLTGSLFITRMMHKHRALDEWTYGTVGITTGKWKPNDSQTGPSPCDFVHNQYHVECPGNKPRPALWKARGKPHELWYGFSYSLAGTYWIFFTFVHSTALEIPCSILVLDLAFPTQLSNSKEQCLFLDRCFPIRIPLQ